MPEESTMPKDRMVVIDWCAVCMQPLKRLPHGAYEECHGGRAYWSTLAAYPGDPAFRRAKTNETKTDVKLFYYFRMPGRGL